MDSGRERPRWKPWRTEAVPRIAKKGQDAFLQVMSVAWSAKSRKMQKVLSQTGFVDVKTEQKKARKAGEVVEDKAEAEPRRMSERGSQINRALNRRPVAALSSLSLTASPPLDPNHHGRRQPTTRCTGG